ncbi:MAG TPA: ribosome biogenesis/translation initiation ATPase RLI [Methanocorpusculum sp.]|nr:ribosome biogenesis/translation initiation ATPase RLI [Methanocorpusculum sp.]HJJ40508.1 ribosome biogenesis/translation initiation ATPase RLI [Methanocorpusculum sp.]HJJ49875.1 ribosome biogenesis/translation initiation ATPase RLI [Methanocorpusculum sp.]HJJ57817.1 ribosome biogenesis/translation initiation ATPase RLI [Methanocorpusculum sp.]HJJ95467.1 ribosome biogenesis/translation initiation ATPase RLI [Methanocorpusculum sp.]
MRIAIVHKDRCHSKKCGQECIIYCPRVRTGDETVVIGENGRAVVSEELCVGCGICVKKCPFEALDIIQLPEELDTPVNRYGPNAFVLYGLPQPVSGKVTGVLGPNGIGKSTAVKILSGQIRPNLGIFDHEVSWKEVLDNYAGTELFEYLQKVSEKSIKASIKPQYIDFIPKAFKGKVVDLLKANDERGKLAYYVKELALETILDKDLSTLSGGELQRVALTVALSKKANFYFLDEVTPFLDIYQRMVAARLIREIAEECPVVLVEHDIAILDMVAEAIHIAYGKPAAFGIITRPKGVRIGVNQYLAGYVDEENVRIRDYPVVFETRGHESDVEREILMDIPAMTKTFPGFKLTVQGGQVRRGEVLGIVGANGIGKSTFAKLLAGVEKPDDGSVFDTVTVSYKPQYVTANPDSSDTVEFVLRQVTKKFDTSYYQNEIIGPLGLGQLLQAEVRNLSGGELQRVAIALCLSREADLYILDEPSAHLDVEQRLVATKVIKRSAEEKEAGIMVIDHDMYTIDMLSERLLVFDGIPGKEGLARGPFEMKDGMNLFLSNLGITFRRDKTGRPRINKPNSYLDREQKAAGEYYYYNAKDTELAELGSKEE